MKKQMTKMLAGGIVLGSLLTMGVGHASEYLESIDVFTKPLTITLNGEALAASDKPNQFHNGTEYLPDAFQYRGTTYVPISFIAKELGKTVAWEQDTRTIALKDERKPGGIWAGSLEPSISMKSDDVFTYTVKNQTELEQKIEFSSGQRYDFAVKNKAGEQIYLFSSLASFMQAIGEETLKQGEELTYDIDLSEVGLEPGEYTVEFWLTPMDGNYDEYKVSVEYVVE